MKVTLQEYGGIAAGIRRPPRTLDTATLAPAQAEELTRLVFAATAASAGGDAGPGRARDAMSYEMTIEDGGRHTVLRGADNAMSPAFAELCAQVKRLGKSA
jgi:hypothetical protein